MPAPESGYACYELAVRGFKGGHSGMDIILCRGNANKVAARVLLPLLEEAGVKIIDLEGITVYYAIAVALVAISHLVLTRTRKGKYFIAVGDNASGANLVGISVLGTKILAYVLCGLFAGLGGFVFASKYGQVMTVAGNGYEMTAIAACVLGGISLSGGLGNMVGASVSLTQLISSINKMPLRLPVRSMAA